MRRRRPSPRGVSEELGPLALFLLAFALVSGRALPTAIWAQGLPHADGGDHAPTFAPETSVPGSVDIGSSVAVTPAPAPPGSSPASSTRLKIPFASGETLRYSLAWLSIGGGEMTISTTPPAPYRGREALTIRMEAKSNSFFSKFFLVDDVILSSVETSRFESMKFEKHTVEGKHRNDDIWLFDLDKRETFYEGKRVQLRSHVLDTLSAVFYLRLLPLKVGKPIYLDAYNNGKNYQLRVDVLGVEQVAVPAGTFRTWKLEPKLQGGFLKSKEGRLLIWMTDDESRVPVKIRVYLPVGYVTGSLLAPDQAAPAGDGALLPEREATPPTSTSPARNPVTEN